MLSSWRHACLWRQNSTNVDFSKHECKVNVQWSVRFLYTWNQQSQNKNLTRYYLNKIKYAIVLLFSWWLLGGHGRIVCVWGKDSVVFKALAMEVGPCFNEYIGNPDWTQCIFFSSSFLCFCGGLKGGREVLGGMRSDCDHGTFYERPK